MISVSTFTSPLWIAIGVAVSVLFSFLVWWIYRADRVLAVDHRESTTEKLETMEKRAVKVETQGKEIIELLKSEPSDEPDPQIQEFHKRFDEIESATRQMIEVVATLPDQMEHIRKQMDGAVGRQAAQINKASKAILKEEADFLQGLDDMADQHLIENLHPLLQPVALAVAESGNPLPMTWIRKWMAKRPDAQLLMANAPGSPQLPQQNGKSLYDQQYG